MNQPRNLIGFAGGFAAGKTVGIRFTRAYLEKHGIPYEHVVISDSPYLIRSLAVDHQENGGRDHIHESDIVGDGGIFEVVRHNDREGHTHDEGPHVLDFIVTNRSIPSRMFQYFFQELSQRRDPSKIYLFEWAGGQTGHDPEHPSARADYSFTRMIDAFEKGQYAFDWIPRTLGIIHVWSPEDFLRRSELNERRRGIVPSIQEIEAGTTSWWVPDAALRHSGTDDFSVIAQFLEHAGLSGRIHHVENNGSTEYFHRLEETLEQMLRPCFDAEGRWRGFDLEGKKHPRLIFVTGLPASGKSQASREIINLLESRGLRVRFRTDKEALEEEVRRDINRFRDDPRRHLNDGSVEGDHSILQNPDGKDGTLQMVFKDGNALNTAHKRMLEEAQTFLANQEDEEVLVIEWAYGKDVPYRNEELTHCGTQLVAWLHEYRLLDEVAVVDIVANAHDRIERNSRRPGHIPTGEFTLYFPEDGHFTAQDLAELGPRYRRVDNAGTTKETYEWFLRRIHDEAASFLLPLLGQYGETREHEPFLPGKER